MGIEAAAVGCFANNAYVFNLYTQWKIIFKIIQTRPCAPYTHLNLCPNKYTNYDLMWQFCDLKHC